MKKRIIKQLVLTKDFEAIYSEPDGKNIREPIDGLAVVSDGVTDSIEPVFASDVGVSFCADVDNYVGIARVGQPHWMEAS